jgi:hypothetical protein
LAASAGHVLFCGNTVVSVGEGAADEKIVLVTEERGCDVTLLRVEVEVADEVVAVD